MNAAEAKKQLESVRAGAAPAAPIFTTGDVPGVGKSITLPLDINQAIRVLIASYDPEQLRILSRDLARMVKGLDQCGKPSRLERDHEVEPEVEPKVEPEHIDDRAAIAFQPTSLDLLAEQIRRDYVPLSHHNKDKIGPALIEVMARLPTRAFKPWIEKNCPFGYESAKFYLRSARAVRNGSDPRPGGGDG